MINKTKRLYADLAWLWPMWGDPSEYSPYCDHVTQLIRQYAKREARSLLNLGCGGGKNVFNLKKHFVVTGIDIASAMLNLASQLNPECQFHHTDMRKFRLREHFDAILVDDAVSYMTTEEDLRAVFARAYAHLNAGGVMVCSPDDTKETFAQNRTQISYAATAYTPAHLDVVFIENYFDPNPDDTEYEATMTYLIRDKGKLRIEHDFHFLGLFPLEVWRTLLLDVGFEVHETNYTDEGREYVTFACVKPT